MSERVLIRTCRSDDLPLLEWNGLFTHHREIIERTYREQLAGNQVMLVAEVDGSPRAQSWIDLRGGLEHRAGIIWAVRVEPGMQGRGLGSHLLRAAEEVIRDHGLVAAELVVETANTSARLLYERLGYRRMRHLTHTYSYRTPSGEFFEHHLDVIEMRKELSGGCHHHR